MSAVPLVGDTSAIPSLVFISHGLKSGPLPKADLYLDCRAIVNPVRVGGLNLSLPSLTTWMRANNEPIINLFTATIEVALQQVGDRRRGENPTSRPFVICTLCAYGQHRSVAMKKILATEFFMAGYEVES